MKASLKTTVRRIGRGLGILAKLGGGLLVFVLFLLTAVLTWLLATGQGLAVSVQAGLEIYNEMIPGSITVERIEGPLFRKLVLHDVLIEDAQGRALVKAKRLNLRWDLFSILDKDLRVYEIGLDNATVTLWEHEGQSGFSDLAPVSDSPPEPEPIPHDEEPSTGVLPSLPFAIGLDRLSLRGVTVKPNPGADAKDLVDGLVLEAAARWDETGLHLRRFESRSRVPLVPLTLQRLSFTASLSGYEVSLPHLELTTDLASIQLKEVQSNLESFESVVNLTAKVPAEAVQKLAGASLPGDLKLSLSAKGNPDDLHADLALNIAETGLTLTTQGGLKPTPKVDLQLQLNKLNPKKFGLPLEGLLNLRVSAKGQGDSLPTAEADIKLSCVECDLGTYGPVALDLVAGLKKQQATAQLNAGMLELTLDLAAASPDLKTIKADLSANLPKLDSLVSALELPPMQAAVNLSSHCEGDIRKPGCNLTLGVSDVAVQDIQVKQLTLEAQTSWDGETPQFETTLRVPSVALPQQTVRGITLAVSGTPATQDIKLSIFHNERNQGRLALQLQPKGPKIHWAEGSGMLDGIPLALENPLDVLIEGETVRLSPLVLRIKDGLLKAKGIFRSQGENQLSLSAENLDLGLLRKLSKQADVAGRLSFQIQLDGPLADPSLRLDLEAASLAYQHNPVGTLALGIQAQNKQTDVELSLKKNEQESLVSLQAALPLWISSQAGDRLFDRQAVSDLHLEIDAHLWEVIEPFLPMPDGMQVRLGLTSHVHGNLDAFTAEVGVLGKLRPARKSPTLPLELSLLAKERRQEVTLTVKDNPLGKMNFQTVVQVDIPALAKGVPLDVKALALDSHAVLYDLDLSSLNPLLPDAIEELTGTLSGDIQVGGTAALPSLSGGLSLADVGVTVVPIHQRLSKLGLSLLAEGRRFSLKDMSAKLGTGKILAKGEVSLSDSLQPKALLTITLDELPLEFPGSPPGQLDSTIQIDFRQDEQGTRGDIELKQTTLQVYSLKTKAPKDIPGNKNIVFVNEAKAKLPQAALPPSVFTVRFEDPLILFGPMLDMAWQGDIEARTEKGQTAVTGGMTLQRGDFDFLGNRFTTDQATVSFPPGTNNTPFLNFVASTDTAEAKVTLILRGPAQAPELSFRSEPAMPQYQIFTLLVTGTTETNEESSDQVQGKAANLGSGLIAMQFPELQQQLSTRLGIDRVGVSFGETTDEPILHVGKRVSRRIYLQTNFHNNAPEDVNTTELMMQLMLTPQWNLETFYGDASVGGMDVFWHRSFGGPEPVTKAKVKSEGNSQGDSQSDDEDQEPGNTTPADEPTTTPTP